MSTLLALALRVLMTASLLLAGSGSHAHGADPVAIAERVPAAQLPCHEGVDPGGDGNDAVSLSPDVGDVHCGNDCQCPCIALPMLVPNGISVIDTAAETATVQRIVLPWRSAASLPSLRPPIA